ncbi:choline-sulfatase [Limibacillus sp. MBR-115]|jgi:choline-sulfatase|uniref:choline-sulfatase n=1 Tax=Limibacillus sp. MBR-115 TaxID=3156465 RepID=UPI00339A2C33
MPSGKAANILFIMVDQMTPGVLPSYGGKVVRSPHLDALAERSVLFDSAYCNAPLCAPSRFSMMTGRLPKAIGAFDNACDLAADRPTFAHYLRHAGYRTALSGKMHFCGPDQLHGFEERLTTDIYPADYGWFCDWEDFETRPSWYHNMASVLNAGPCVRSNQLDFDDEVGFNAERWLYDWVRGNDERPFALTVSFTHPHDPYAIGWDYWRRYSDDEIDMPQVKIDPKDLDPHSKRLRHVYALEGLDIPEDKVRAARRAYYGAISYLDDKIGRLLSVLDQIGVARDTYIVFCGDHGDMLGERGLWYKMSWFEPSSRIPLMIAGPGIRPGQVSSSVSLVDLLPTLAELAGDGKAPDYATEIDGRSLQGHLSGSGGHDEVLGEYCGEGAIAPLFMIRRGRFKYIATAPDPDQLFDLEADPHELNNLAEDPNAAATLAAFREEAATRWDAEGLRDQVLDSQRRRRLVYQALSQGERLPWDFQPLVDASERYMRNHRDLDDVEGDARWPRTE